MPEFTVSCACGHTKVAVNIQSEKYVLQLVCLHCKELILNRQSQPHVAEIIESENQFHPKDKQSVAKDNNNYFGKYIVVKKLGEGGMAAVYKAIDSENQQPIALKIFKKLDDENSLQYIMREAKILAKLQHPNIVAFKKAGTHKQFPYIAMEYIDGKSLDELLQLYGSFEPKDAVQIMLYVIEAMIYASQFQLVHRDIKPANILISQSGVIKLIDLGVGKILEDSGALTRTGEVVGTCFYMPYEQFQDSKNIDFRVDVYAIGATLYNLLCGVPPYWEYGENVNKLIFAKIGNRYIPLSEKKPGIPKVVLNLVEKAMKHDPKERYQTLFEMKKEWLTAYQQL